PASARRGCSSGLRWRDSSSLRRISARSSSTPPAGPGAAPASGFTSVTFLRTTTSTGALLRPPPTVSVLLRCRVILRGATGSASFSVRPWVRRRKPRSFTFSVLVTTWSGSLNCMPASDSCSSSFSTGVFTSAASLRMVVCCDIRIPVPLASASAARGLAQFMVACRVRGRGRPGLSAFRLQAGDLAGARRQHQGGGTVGVQVLDAELQHLVHGQVGQVLGRAHAVRRERVGGGLVHALERQQVVGGQAVAHLLLHRQGVVEQGVAGTGAQFLDDIL